MLTHIQSTHVSRFTDALTVFGKASNFERHQILRGRGEGRGGLHQILRGRGGGGGSSSNINHSYFRVNDEQWHKVSVGGYNVTQTNYQVNGLEDDAQYQFLVVTTSAGGASSEESRVQLAATLPLSKYHPSVVCDILSLQ